MALRADDLPRVPLGYVIRMLWLIHRYRALCRI